MYSCLSLISSACSLHSNPGRKYLYSSSIFNRLYAGHSRRPGVVLHEDSSQILYGGICDIVSFRRCRWFSSKIPEPDIGIWCRSRHGDRQARVCIFSPLFSSLDRECRCTTSCLLCHLSSAYPEFAILFQFLISLDFSSHYMHMYRSALVHSHAFPEFY
jgi:hypothetical protein